MADFPYVRYFFFFQGFCKDDSQGSKQGFFAFFINMGWILSEPLDFVSLTLSIAFSNFLSVISTEWSGSMKGRSWKSGKFSLPSFSNTLTKNLFRILAFS